jgi:hypothetical protein
MNWPADSKAVRSCFRHDTRAMHALPLVLVLVSTLGISACADLTADSHEIAVVSSRADMVTGGDALVRVVPSGISIDKVRISINGTDATAAFRTEAGGKALTGLVTGLRVGSNTVAIADGQRTLAKLEVTNHPATGPVFSGPHETPFICETATFQLVNGETLGPTLDADCSAKRKVVYIYGSKDGKALKPLRDTKSYPQDLARTTTSLGVDVPYIVRVETGTANRAIYELAILHDPIAEPEPNALTRPAGWNQRLVYRFGGGCVGGWYRQGARTGGVTDEMMLRQGYAIASSTLNVFGINCNDLLASETLMMVKERFIEAYGAPKFMIAWGSSGGSYQSEQTADNYPGLVDGAVVGASYPDVFSYTSLLSDVRLLMRYFDKTTGVPYTNEQKRALTGFSYLDLLPFNEPNASRINPTELCPDVLPVPLRYHPQNNRTGARCDVFSHTINVYGRNPETGFARRPLDNVGRQYGLKALNDGAITKEQFLDVNERIGGYDIDANFIPERTVADPAAIRAGHETGRFLSGAGGLNTTPLIDYRVYNDEKPGGDGHPRFYSFSTEARLIKANGHIDNRVMLTVQNRFGNYTTPGAANEQPLAQMDRWLTALVEDKSGLPPVEKMRRARPADLVDACWSRDEVPKKIAEKQTREPSSRCAQLYPPGSFPSEVAGGPISLDIAKCQLKPIDRADYRVQLTDAELARLRKVFPAGVCDWSKPGVEQHGLRGTWQVIPNTNPIRATDAATR